MTLVAVFAGTIIPNVPAYAADVQTETASVSLDAEELQIETDEASAEVEQPGENTSDQAEDLFAESEKEQPDELIEDTGDELLEEPPCEDFTLSPSAVNLGEMIEGQKKELPSQTVTLKYTGEGAGYVSSVISRSFDLSIENRYFDKSTPVEIKVEPKLNLNPGLYSEMIRIESTIGEYCLLRADLSVVAQNASFKILEPHDDVDFGYICIGDEKRATERAKTFTVKNTGNVRMQYSFYSPWADVTPEDDFFLVTGEEKEITVKPKTDGSIYGSFTVTIYGEPDKNYYTGPKSQEEIKCRDDVGYYLYGTGPEAFEGKKLVDGMDYELVESTVIKMNDVDEKTIGSIGSKVDGCTLEIQGSQNNTLTVNGPVYADGAITINGAAVNVKKGYIQSTKDINIKGGIVDVDTDWIGINSTGGRVTIGDQDSLCSQVSVTGGSRGIVGRSVLIEGSSVVDVSNHDSGGAGIIGQNGIIIKDKAYVSAETHLLGGGIGIGTFDGDIQIVGNALVHAAGSYALLAQGDHMISYDKSNFTLIPKYPECEADYEKDDFGARFVDKDTREDIKEIVIRRTGEAKVEIEPANYGFDPTGYGDPAPAKKLYSIVNRSPFAEQICDYSFFDGLSASDDYIIDGNILGKVIPTGMELLFYIQPKEKLSAGEHNAKFVVYTEAGTEVTPADIRYNVTPPTATISQDKSLLDFGTVREGYDDIAAQTVTITNTSPSPITITFSDPADSNYIVTISPKSIAKGKSATVTIRPKSGLLKGDYSRDDFFIESDKGVFAKIDLDFVVNEWKYELTGSSDKVDLGHMHVGYTTPASQSYTLENTGEKPLNVTGYVSKYGQELIKEDIAGKTVDPGEKLTFTVAAPEDAPEGTYRDEITVNAEGEGGKTASCTFTVDYSVEYFIEGDVNASELVNDKYYKAYGDATITLSDGDDVSVSAIDGKGDGTITITGSDRGSFTVGWLDTEGGVFIDAGSVSCGTLRAQKAVTIDKNAYYSGDLINSKEAVNIGGSSTVILKGADFGALGNFGIIGGGEDSVPVSFTGSPYLMAHGNDAAVLTKGAIKIPSSMKIWKPDGATIGDAVGFDGFEAIVAGTENATEVRIGAKEGTGGELTVSHGNVDFGEYTSDDEIPEPRTITLTNTGEPVLVLDDLTAYDDEFVFTQPEKKILRPGESTTFTVQPKEGLSAGSGHIGYITIRSDKTPDQNIYMTVRIEEPVYKLIVTDNGVDITGDESKAIDFGKLYVGYEGGLPHELTVTNEGNTTLTMEDPIKDYTYGFPGGYDAGKLSKTVLEPGDSATFTLSVWKIFFAGETKVKVDIKGSTAKGSKSVSVYGKYKAMPSPAGHDGDNNIIWMMDIPEQTYTGMAVKPEPEVYFRSTKLTADDYKVTYKNNKNAARSNDEKAPTVTVTGKGKYAGTITMPFTINPLPIENAYTDSDAAVAGAKKLGLTIANLTLPFNDRVQKGSFKLYIDLPNGKRTTLSEGKKKDYELLYVTDPNPKAPGLYTIKVNGHGNFTGTRTLTLEIKNKSAVTMLSKVSVPTVPAQSYNGTEFVAFGDALPGQTKIVDKNGNGLEIVDKAKKYTLVINHDYKVLYSNNKDVGTATATVIGIGDYAGTVRKTFKINGIPMKKAVIPNDFSGSEPYAALYDKKAKAFIYTGEPFEVAGPETGTEDYGIKLVYTGPDKNPVTLNKGSDYTVKYSKNIEKGTATVEFTGKGGMTGTVKKKFKIAPYSITNDTEGRINVYYDNYDPAYLWPAAPDDTKPVYPYLKNGVCPDPVVEYSCKGVTRILKKGKDYTLSYGNYKTVATATGSKPPTVTINGKGLFTGKLSRMFNIRKREATDTYSAVAANYVINYTWEDLSSTGDPVKDYQKLKKMMTPVKTKVTIKDSSGAVLKEGVDYDRSNGWKYKWGVASYWRVCMDGAEEYGPSVIFDLPINTDDFGKELVTPEVRKYYVILPMSIVNVEIKGLGNYEGQTFKCSFSYVYADVSKASVKIPDMQYTGKPVKLSESDITITVKQGKKETTLVPGTDYFIHSNTYINNVDPGTAKVDIEFTTNADGVGITGVRTVSFKIVRRQLNYHISYDGGLGDSTKGLIRMLMTIDPSHDEAWYKQHYKIKGTVKDSYIPRYGKLAAGSFKVLKFDDEKNKWVDAKNILLDGWNTKSDATGTFYNLKGAFEPTWADTPIFGDRYTLYAMWKIVE